MITAPQIIPYERKYRDDVLTLLFYARRVHTHLDWYKASHWLDYGERTVCLAYENGALLGVIGISKPLNDTAWIRIAAVARGQEPAQVLERIWQPLQTDLRAAGIKSVSVLVINSWLTQYLPELNFTYLEDVVTLYRSGLDLPAPPQTHVTLRNGYIEDLDAITAVDHAAFDPPWQMSFMDLRHAQRQAASCTLAMLGDQIIGYQISTRHHTAGHLARLAVVPQMQGQRVGAALLDKLITDFNRRNVRSITVNTQLSNVRSQRLYERYFFARNGFDLPVWICEL